MKLLALCFFFSVGSALRAQIPVTDLANLANNEIMQIETIAKWVESIAQLKTQITQLDHQISLQSDMRNWSGSPTEAAAKVILKDLGREDLVKTYGKAKDTLRELTSSLDSLEHTSKGDYRSIPSLDLNGTELKRDELTYRRYALLDAQQTNAEQVSADVRTREHDLEESITTTLDALKSADTDAEVQKQSAKLAVLTGQLAQIESVRKREVDAVALQKTANDSRIEEERLAADELAARDDYLANQRVSAYLGNLHARTR
jgi:conjugal transfer/entry exclusion protein